MRHAARCRASNLERYSHLRYVARDSLCFRKFEFSLHPSSRFRADPLHALRQLAKRNQTVAVAESVACGPAMCWIRGERSGQFYGPYSLLRQKMLRTCGTLGRCSALRSPANAPLSDSVQRQISSCTDPPNSLLFQSHCHLLGRIAVCFDRKIW